MKKEQNERGMNASGTVNQVLLQASAKPTVGSRIFFDGHALGFITSTVLCEAVSDSFSHRRGGLCQRSEYLTSGTGTPINVVVTGRTWQTYAGYNVVRVRIELMTGDGDQTEFCGGWMRASVAF